VGGGRSEASNGIAEDLLNIFGCAATERPPRVRRATESDGLEEDTGHYCDRGADSNDPDERNKPRERQRQPNDHRNTERSNVVPEPIRLQERKEDQQRQDSKDREEDPPEEPLAEGLKPIFEVRLLVRGHFGIH
jgi:hypothetical protein